MVIKKPTPQRSRLFAGIFQNVYIAWVVLFFGFIVTGVAWHATKTLVISNAEARFDARVEEILGAVHARMLAYEQALWGAVGLFRASESVDRKEFRRYVNALRLQENWPGIQGIGYSIPVAPENKAAHINSIRAEGFEKYTIKPEGERDVYSAIIYLEPFDWRNRRAFGYDMWSNEMRREAMTRARDTGLASTSGIITLVQETDTDVQRGFLTYLPFYASNMPTTKKHERQAAFRGWVYSPFRMGDLMKGILGEGDAGVEYEIFDGNEYTTETLLFDSNETFEGDEFTVNGFFTQSRTLELQGRIWSINFSSGGKQISELERAQPMIVAAVGLVINFLLFFILSSNVSLQRRAVLIADKMSAEAKEAREELEDKLVELEQSNSDLQKFAYIASHELKSPMRAVHQLVEWIEDDLEGIDAVKDTDVPDHLTKMKGRAIRMQGLLDSLLKYATIGRGTAEITSFETMACIQEVIEFIAPPDDVNIHIHAPMPRIVGERALLEQVFANLIGNAIKHRDNQSIDIDISARPLGVLYEFSIKDNGPGIEKQFQERIFELFQTLKRRDELEASGMGLAIVKKAVERRGGTLRVVSDPEKEPGTTFIFTWKSDAHL